MKIKYKNKELGYIDLEQHEKNLFDELDLRLLDYDRESKKRVLISLLNKWGLYNDID